MVSRRDLAADACYDWWEDPDDLARMRPEKRTAVLANPLSRDGDEPVQVIGTEGDRVIGRVDLIAGGIEAGGQLVPCLWGSELYVPVQFRGTRMGLRLILKMQELNHTVAACGVSRSVYPIFKHLKWLDFPMPRYVLLRRGRPVVERYLGVGRTGTVAAAVADLALRAPQAALAAARRLRARGLSVEQVERMATELEPRLRAQAAPVAVHRSPQWINWLLDHAFQNDYRNRRGLFYVRNRRNEIVAYFLIKSRFHETVSDREFKNVLLGSLRDWMIFDPSETRLEHVILFAIGALASWEVDAIEVCVPEEEEKFPLRRWGFVPAGPLRMLVRASPDSPLQGPQYQQPDRWSISPAAGDNFFW